MPSHDKFYRCYCAECCEADRNGRAGNPAGKLQLERHKAIHLRETSLDPAISDVRRASVANLALRAISQQDDSGNSGIDSLSAALFASSLCDNGPDLDSQPSKLWASREEFQEAASTNTGDIGIPDIGDLVDAVGRISTENRSVAFPLSHTSTKPSGLRLRDSKNLKRRELKAHKVLNSIEAQIRNIQQHTLESASVDARAVRSQLGSVRKALTGVNRRTPSIASRKEQLLLLLGKMEKQLGEVVTISEGDSRGAVQYDSCEWLPIVKEFALINLKPIILIILSISATRLPKFRSSSV